MPPGDMPSCPAEQGVPPLGAQCATSQLNTRRASPSFHDGTAGWLLFSLEQLQQQTNTADYFSSIRLRRYNQWNDNAIGNSHPLFYALLQRRLIEYIMRRTSVDEIAAPSGKHPADDIAIAAWLISFSFSFPLFNH